MRLNTLVTLGASAAFGIMAVVLARGWINDAIESEFRDNRPAANVLAKKETPTFPVVIAANDLTFGDELTAEALRPHWMKSLPTCPSAQLFCRKCA